MSFSNSWLSFCPRFEACHRCPPNSGPKSDILDLYPLRKFDKPWLFIRTKSNELKWINWCCKLQQTPYFKLAYLSRLNIPNQRIPGEVIKENLYSGYESAESAHSSARSSHSSCPTPQRTPILPRKNFATNRQREFSKHTTNIFGGFLKWRWVDVARAWKTPANQRMRFFRHWHCPLLTVLN